MPERSFGRTVRYRRTKLGLSQAKLGELVGRSTATVRSWERDQTRPNDAKVLAALAAILGVDERHLFGKADVEPPQFEEVSPTVEQALATLTPPGVTTDSDGSDDSSEAVPSRNVPQVAGVAPKPAYVAPPDPLVRTPLSPAVGDTSYMEDDSQRQMYRIRTLATLVVLVALVIAFIWALGEGLGAFGEWWDGFFGNLRL